MDVASTSTDDAGARYAAASAPLRPPITFPAPRARPPRAEQAHESFVCNLKLGLHRGLRNVVATIRQLRSTIITLVDRGLIGGAQRSKPFPAASLPRRSFPRLPYLSERNRARECRNEFDQN